MMNNLFSTFDPTSVYLSLNWTSMILILFMLPYSYWLIPSRQMLLWMKMKYFLNKEMNSLMTHKKSRGMMLITFSLFTFILINNFLGLFPYIFTSTSHMVITLSLALPLWLSFYIYSWINYTVNTLAHLVPQSTPMMLMPFMVCIETISNLIRPTTLAIRLSANMIAGHLLITLLGNMGSYMSLYMINFLIIIQISLLLLEMAVSIIQSYVFTILVTLYSKEIY